MNKQDILRVQTYLREKLGNKTLVLTERKGDKNSLEVMLGDEFIGTVYRDEEDGEVSYDFNMAILEMDLPPAV